MNKFFLFIFTLSIGYTVHAHEYFFAFGELEYNVVTQKIEGSLSFTTHDFEKKLSNDGKSIPAMESLTLEDSVYAIVHEEINSHLRIKFDGVKVKYSIVGQEVFLTGLTNIYFESQPIESPKIIELTFNLMMDAFIDQQNKIEFILGEEKWNLVFLQNQQKQILKLENKNHE